MSVQKIYLSFLLFSSIFTRTASAQDVVIKGFVKSQNGTPIPYASISIGKSMNGTKADSLGAFSLAAASNAILRISAVGFEDTLIKVEGRNSIDISLRASEGQTLANALVSPDKTADGALPPEQTARDEIIANTLENYARSSMFSNGAYVGSSLAPGARGAAAISHTIIQGFGPLNSVNSGEMLPVVEHKEATKGSRYLFSQPAHGVIVDGNDKLMADSSRLLNYDKIDGQLLIVLNSQNVLEIDKDKVNGFALKTADTSYVFLKAPVIDINRYFILVAYGPAYSVFKSLRTTFVKSNYIDNGLTPSGNNYDEYQDQTAYFLLEQKEQTYKRFELKRKSVQEAFRVSKAKTDEFLTMHRKEKLDDEFLKQLINYIN
jgi:hypothetical protein